MTKPPTLTKADLIEEVLRITELPRKESETIVETIFDSIIESLQKGQKIEIRGFGSFRTRDRRGRIGRNPKTGAKVEVPAKRIPFFKPSKELKDFVIAQRPRQRPRAASRKRNRLPFPFPSESTKQALQAFRLHKSRGVTPTPVLRYAVRAAFEKRTRCDGLHLDSLALPVHGAGGKRKAARVHFLRCRGAKG